MGVARQGTGLSIAACGQRQKKLYGCIVAFQDKHGRMLRDMNELISDVHETRSFHNCPTGRTSYVVHFENFGNPHAVLIDEQRNRRHTALRLRLQAITPRVQTFGDGTIHLFKDGKLAAIHAAK